MAACHARQLSLLERFERKGLKNLQCGGREGGASCDPEMSLAAAAAKGSTAESEARFYVDVSLTAASVVVFYRVLSCING